MNLKRLKFLLLFLICLPAASVYAQYGRTTSTNTNPFTQGDTSHRKTAKPLTDDELLDTLRKRDEHKGDTVIFTSKFIRVTNEKLLNDSTQVLPLDTTLTNFENYSALYQPRHPTIGLGNLGLAYRNLLFEPQKSIGFDVGLHFLDAYLLKPEDVTYYRARTPFTNLYYVNGALKEQVFKVTHTQNIKPNWNAGFNFNRIGSVGYYPRQKSDHLEAAIFTWYESKNKRYNLLGNLTFNNLKAPENGSILNDTIFTKPSASGSLAQSVEPVRLNNSRDNWRSNGLYIKQFYYIGRTEGLKTGAGSSSSVLPTQRVSHTFTYNRTEYKYLQDEADLNNEVFPLHRYDTLYSRDSVAVTHFRNEFSYSFYLRGNAVKFVRNELKLDLGLVHDYYKYGQYVRAPGIASTQNIQQKVQGSSFQDITLKARAGYNVSDRAGLDINLQQVVLGREFGDYLYDAKLNVLLSNKIGRVIMEAYTQSNTPPLIYTNWNSSHYQFSNSNFSKTKTTSLSFNYINDKLQLDAKAEYFLLGNYLYFAAPDTVGNFSNNLKAMQAGGAISLLKLSLAKNFTYHSFHLDNFLVYQKTSNANILRTPDFYAYTSFYYRKKFFNVLSTNYGFAVRYNTTYLAQAYAPGIGQFYNNSSVSFPSYPVIDLFIKATLRRTNIFLKYDYANQGLFSKGFYTVLAPGANAKNIYGYPMQDALLKFGVSWNFYD